MRCHAFLAVWTLQHQSAALSRSGEANVTVDEARHSPGGSNRSATQLQLGGFEDLEKTRHTCVYHYKPTISIGKDGLILVIMNMGYI